KMEANQRRFREAEAGVLAALSPGAQVAWSEVLTRLRQAEDAARDGETLTRQIAQEQQQGASDRLMLDARDGDAAAIGACLGWSEADGSLSDHLARCREATTLREGIAALRDDLRDRPAPRDGEETAII